MGIPQVLIIALILFTVLVHDLTKIYKKQFKVCHDLQLILLFGLTQLLEIFE